MREANLQISTLLKLLILCTRKNGGLAQLARAFDWQSKGQRFDSAILHLIIKALQKCEAFFLSGVPFWSALSAIINGFRSM